MSNFILNFELRKDRPDRLGKCQIRIRVSIGRKSKYVGTKMKVHPDNWDSVNQ